MAMRKVKVGDTVIVLTGKDKGRTGKVLRYLQDNRLVVEGVNKVKKHQRGNPNRGQQSQIIEREAGIDASNVSVLNPQTNKADRVGFKFLEDGAKVRYFKSNNEVIDVE